MSYFINNGLTRHNLEDLYFYYFGEAKEKFKDVMKNESKRNYKDFSEVPLEFATNYAAYDSYATLQLFNRLNPLVAQDKNNWIYYEVDKKLSLVLQDMESVGFKIDRPLLSKLELEIGKEIHKIEKKIFSIAGEDFNVASPKQLTVIFKKLEINVSKKTKAGDFQTNVSVLEQLESEGIEIATHILQWRQYSKLHSTYTSSLADHADKGDRIHSTFNIASTITGRLSSSEPNLQNIPIRSDVGKKIRTAFIADNHFKLYSLDYSQIELRILCEACQDPILLESFKNNIDIHESTAQLVFNKKDINPDDGRMAKIINFGIIYGISAFGLAKQLSVSNQEAKLFIENYFKKFPNIENFMKSSVENSKKNGYIENLFGRKSFIKNINSKNFMLRSYAERLAINAPIQGSASDLIKIAMIKIDTEIKKQKLKTRMISQVHDELLFEVHNKEEKFIEEIINIMEKGHEEFIKFDTPIKVDSGSGKNWSEAH